MRIVIILFFMLGACAQSPALPDDNGVHIKRTSMWVPDLDRAIIFFHDVIGLDIEDVSELDLEPDSVLFDVFNADPDLKLRRALFSTSQEKRILFVMESADAPQYSRTDKRAAILVIRTNDLAGVMARAKANGFNVGQSNTSVSSASGQSFQETTIFGPAGHAVLMYEFGE